MAESADICAQCGKQGSGFKRCSVCKQASYCGVACQKKDWKRHKKDCTAPVPVMDVAAKIQAAQKKGDWQGMLQWEGRMEELMAVRLSDDRCSLILSWFSNAHLLEYQATGITHHARSCAGLVQRRIPFLGKLQRFRDQGDEMCKLADILRALERTIEAATWYAQARNVGAAHGFFSLECTACMGLGKAAMAEGRHEEGVALLRNAVVAAELNELDDPAYELDALNDLIGALFMTQSIVEVESLVLRFRELYKASDAQVGFCFEEFNSLLWFARIHEVINLYTPCLLTPPATFNNHHRILPALDTSHIHLPCTC
jgi:hypothetical protein